MEAEWMKIVAGEMNTAEIAGKKHNPRIIEYHSTTTLKATQDEVPWCSSFVNWVMKQANLPRTKSAAAKSWLDWGVKLKLPKYGCVVVMPRTGGNHVTFWVKSQPNFKGVPGFIGRGGNQSNRVKDSWYADSTVSGYRWPDTVPLGKLS